MDAPDTARAIAIFDALCERHVRDFVDPMLFGDLVDAIPGSGRAAQLVTQHLAPSRQRILARLATVEDPPVKLGDAIPAGVLELIIAMLPSLPPAPRKLVEEAIGSPEVRTEVRRLLEETVTELVARAVGKGERSGPLSVFGGVARAATAAGRGVVGAIGGALGADLESKLSGAIEFGVGLAQRRIVETASSPETAKRFGKELARIVPRVAEMPESEVAASLSRAPFPILDGLLASLIAHNAARPRVRQLIVDELTAVVNTLSETTIGELLDRFGARAPLRAVTQRRGGAVVAAITARLSTP